MTNDDDGDGGDDDAAAAKAARKAEESARRRKARRRRMNTGSTAFGRAGDEDVEITIVPVQRQREGSVSGGGGEENGESMAIGGRKVVADRWIPCATHDVL